MSQDADSSVGSSSSSKDTQNLFVSFTGRRRLGELSAAVHCTYIGRAGMQVLSLLQQEQPCGI